MASKYDVTVDLPNVMKGVDIEVPFLGVVPNGTTRRVELDPSDASHLRTAHGIGVKKVAEAKKKKTTFSQAPTSSKKPETLVNQEGGDTA